MWIYWETRLYKRLDDGQGSWSTDYTVLDQVYNKNIIKGMADKKDIFSFNVNNNYNKYYSTGAKIENGDKIEFYGKLNSSTITSSDLLLQGVVKSVNEKIGTANILEVKGYSATEQFLKGLTFVTANTPLTPPAILQRALSFHNEYNQNFQIGWKSTNTSTKTGTSTAFPTHEVADFYKAMNLLFERYSSNEYTEDGNYYYYLDENNDMVWEKMVDTSEGTLNETDCQNVSFSNDSGEVYNTFIVYCGTDPKGIGISVPYFDSESQAKHGAKWKPITTTNDIASTIMQNEIDSDANLGTSTAVFDPTTNGWFPTSYDYTTTFGETATSDASYTEIIRERAKVLGKARVKEIMDGIRDTRIKAKCALPFTNNYGIGQVLTCNFPTYGIVGTNLRVKDIQFTDFSTILHLEQDELI